MSPSLRAVFEAMDASILERISEIRLRKGRAVIIVIRNTSYFIDYNGDLYDCLGSHCVVISAQDFDTIFMELCSYSLYSSMDSLINGYLTLSFGARVGVSSSAVYEGNRLISVKNINSLNIRIPIEAKGCADSVLNFLYVNAFPSIIVAGKPNSGKTTLLRDIARQLSGGFNNRYRKVAIVDERNEIAGNTEMNTALDVGINTDVLSSFSKSKGIEIATRTLSPEMIICDEISTEEELSSILFAFSSGVRFALSVHAQSKDELIRKPIVKRLLETGEFPYIVMLGDYTYKAEIIDSSEVYDETCRLGDYNSFYNGDRRDNVKRS